MDKIFSARLDAAAIDVMNRVTRRLRISKKRFIEEAIHLRAQAVEGDPGTDVWAETVGAWHRHERTAQTVENARRQFRNAILRHHRGKNARLYR